MSTTPEGMTDQPVSELEPARPNREPVPLEGAPQGESHRKAPAIQIILACVGAAAIPGGGHFILGRWGRGLVLAFAVLGMFSTGLFWMQGHLFFPNQDDLVSIFPFLANLGLGGIYLLCYSYQYGFQANADVPTFEFGNTFLLVAGLMNYLIILDAYDLAVGRKK